VGGSELRRLLGVELVLVDRRCDHFEFHGNALVLLYGGFNTARYRGALRQSCSLTDVEALVGTPRLSETYSITLSQCLASLARA